MAKNLFWIVSGDPKWPKTTFWSFLVTRNGRKPLFSRFERKDALEKVPLLITISH